MEVHLLAIALILALAFANGANDVSKAIATLVGSGVSNYRTAITWGTAWTMVGAGASVFIANAMIRTFSAGLLQPDTVVSSHFAVSLISGALAWVWVASWIGLPVSTTHALVGAMVGAGLVAYGHQALIWPSLIGRIALPLLLSPVLAIALSVSLHPVIRIVAKRWEGICICLVPAYRALITVNPQGETHTVFQTTAFGRPAAAIPTQCDRAGLRGLIIGLDACHWLSSGLASLARGANDTPKIVAVLLIGGLFASRNETRALLLIVAGVALAMGLGSFLGGFRVTQVLAEKVTKMDHAEGLSANLTTSSLVLVSTTLGLPVSTTHVSSSAIIGIGLLKGLAAVRWLTVRDMVLAWLVTLPAAGVCACLSYLVLSRLV